MNRRSQTLFSPQLGERRAPRPSRVLPQLDPGLDPSERRVDESGVGKLPADRTRCRPRHATWQLTLESLAFPLSGEPLSWEARGALEASLDLSTAECLAIVEQLATLGVEEVTLAGGDASFRHDWLEVVHAISARRMRCAMTTGGRGFHVERAHAVAAAGVQSVSVALDGLESTHDQRRATPGAFRVGLHALTNVRAAGVPVAVHTELGRARARELHGLLEIIVAHGAHCWELELSNEPSTLPATLPALPMLLEALAKRCAQAGLRLTHGPRLRSALAADSEGASCTPRGGSLSIGADGSIRGCPSWSSQRWPGGNLRSSTLVELWSGTPSCHAC